MKTNKEILKNLKYHKKLLKKELRSNIKDKQYHYASIGSNLIYFLEELIEEIQESC